MKVRALEAMSNDDVEVQVGNIYTVIEQGYYSIGNPKTLYYKLKEFPYNFGFKARLFEEVNTHISELFEEKVASLTKKEENVHTNRDTPESGEHKQEL